MGIEAWSFSKAVVNEISISFRSQYLLLEKGEYSALYVHAAGAMFPDLFCRWWELPQTSYLSRQTRVCRHKHVFVPTKHLTKVYLSRQNFLQSFVARNICRHNTCLSRQKYACRDKIMFVAANMCHDKSCHDKHILTQQSILLSRQKTCFVATNTIFCRDNIYACGSFRQLYCSTVGLCFNIRFMESAKTKS